MAYIEKRGKRWRALIRRKGFPPESATFMLKAQAEAWARDRDSELTGSRHGVIPKRTVKQAIERYTREECPKHRGERWEKIRLGKILRNLPFKDRLLESVQKGEIASWRDSMSGLATSSARREYGLLRAVFSACAGEWGWLKQSPFTGVTPPAEGKPRTRRVSDAEADLIIAALGYARGLRPDTASQFVAAAFLLSIETAMRLGELLSTTREQVKGRIIRLERTKNGDARDVPLSAKAANIVDLLPDKGFIFPISEASADALFRRARTRAGLVDIHFHDARREGATRIAAKVDVMTLAKITGHRDIKTLLRVYYAPSMAEVATRLD